MSLSTPGERFLAAAQGDDAALAQLIQAYHKRVYRFGRRVCRTPEDAEDAVQEAFIKLARRPDVVAHPGALSWLFSVVRYACALTFSPLLLLVPRQTLKSVVDRLESDQPSPEQALQRWELVQAVHAAIAALEKPYREVLVLRALAGLSGEETCRALGIELASMSRACVAPAASCVRPYALKRHSAPRWERADVWKP